jgi:hypothetical protein
VKPACEYRYHQPKSDIQTSIDEIRDRMDGQKFNL